MIDTTDTSTSDPTTHRRLTVLPLAMMVTVVCGVGVVSANEVLREAGGLGGIIATVSAALFVALPQAWCVSELGAMMPTRAGSIVWITRGLGPRYGFVYGWLAACTSLGDISTGIALCSQLVVRLSGFADDGLPFAAYVFVRLIFLGVGAVCALVNPRLLARAVMPLTFPLLVIVAAGLAFSLPTLTWTQLSVNTAAPVINLGSLAATALWQMTGMIGLGTMAGDMAKPADFIKGLASGLALLVSLYVGVMLVMTAQAEHGYDDFTRPMFLLVAFNNVYNGLGAVLGILMVFMSFASLVGAYIVDARALCGLSQMGWAPAFMADQREDGTPTVAIVVIAAATLPLAYFSLPTLVVLFYTLGALAQMMPCIALLRLRFTNPQAERPMRIPGGMPVNAFVVSTQLVGLFFVAASNALFNSGIAVVCFGVVSLIVTLTGVPSYFASFEMPTDGSSQQTMEATPLLSAAGTAVVVQRNDPQQPADSTAAVVKSTTSDDYVMRRLRELKFLD